MRPWLAITPGDPDGIGPEIVWKFWKTIEKYRDVATFVCIGAQRPFEMMNVPIDVCEPDLLFNQNRKNSKKLLLIPAPTVSKKSVHLSGFQAGWSIETATRLALQGRVSAIVTGPIQKERFNAGGYPFPGHTEFLASLCKTKSVTMMLANSQMRVTLVTCHLPLSAVSKNITRLGIRSTVNQTLKHLQRYWGIKHPKIGVAALNPHGGEGGLFGNEEATIIEPELKYLRKIWAKRAEIDGPFPADTLFLKKGYDAFVCMYHDQGLTPVKLVDFSNTVNVSLGLPVIRTSVDHGTGFDIAGKGVADPSSLCSAVSEALIIIKNCRKLRA